MWCVSVSLSLSHWYSGSGVVLDCIDSQSLHPKLLSMMTLTKIFKCGSVMLFVDCIRHGSTGGVSLAMTFFELRALYVLSQFYDKLHK